MNQNIQYEIMIVDDSIYKTSKLIFPSEKIVVIPKSVADYYGIALKKEGE